MCLDVLISLSSYIDPKRTLGFPLAIHREPLKLSFNSLEHRLRDPYNYLRTDGTTIKVPFIGLLQLEVNGEDS